MRPVLRITGGKARGRRLYSPAGRGVRPSPARVRIALFNILGTRAEGIRVLDLFAGTGSLGLEALSRGAASCLFVEQDPTTLRRNIEATGFHASARVHQGDVFQSLPVLRWLEEPVELVFLDPPHRFWRTKKPSLIGLLKSLGASGAVRDEAIWVLGHPDGSPTPGEVSFLGPLDRRSYGEAHVTIANR